MTLSAASENGICGRDQHHQHNMHLNIIFRKSKNNPKAFWQGLSSVADGRMKLCDGLPLPEERFSNRVFCFLIS